MSEWQTIESAPKDGTHILGCWGRYDEHWTFNQQPPCVVHYWSNPGEEGFYNSLGDTEAPLNIDFWQPLPSPPRRDVTRAIEASCPKCGANPGRKCIKPDGSEFASIHDTHKERRR